MAISRWHSAAAGLTLGEETLMRKRTMFARQEPDLIARLQAAWKTNDATINHTISSALDALET